MTGKYVVDMVSQTEHQLKRQVSADFKAKHLSHTLDDNLEKTGYKFCYLNNPIISDSFTVVGHEVECASQLFFYQLTTTEVKSAIFFVKHHVYGVVNFNFATMKYLIICVIQIAIG